LMVGGQVYAGGLRDGRPWRVGVRDPRGGPEDVFATIEATNVSVSTSGDYERFFIVDDVRYHHILDPSTGWPARGLRSATVICAEATLADALSTAIMVLGPDKGLVLAEDLPGVEAVLVGEDGRVYVTSAAPIVVCGAETPPLLSSFCDPVYLHQVKVKGATGKVVSCPDLAEALALHRESGRLQGEWRIHFHVPLYFTAMGAIRSTSTQLTPDFFKSVRECGIEHLEIETYTFDVLPAEMQALGVEASIAAEYQWVLQRW